MTTTYQRQWTTATPDRTCGSCYACCIYLGIEALHKYTGQTCRHLDGKTDPTKRCSIYANRPAACSGYHCMWRAGFGPEELKPNESGILLTGYPREDALGVAITATIFDYAKAKPIIDTLIREIISLDFELRLIHFYEKTSLLFKDGNIYQCKLLPPDNYESLTFIAKAPPIGHYANVAAPSPESTP